MTGRARIRTLVVAGACAALVAVLAGCGANSGPRAASPGEAASSPPTGAATTGPFAMRAPGRLEDPLLSPDLLVVSQRPLPRGMVESVKALPGVVGTEPLSLATFFVEEQAITYAAVDPATFRRYTPDGSANTEQVWDRVASGEMAIDPTLGHQIEDSAGYVRMGNDQGSPRVHVGAYAQLSSPLTGRAPFIDAVVNSRWAPRLRMKPGNALLVSTGSTTPTRILKRLSALAGQKASVRILGPRIDPGSVQTAILTGGSIAAAVGTFGYTANADGSVNPDPRWVRAYIRTEQVPILGRVTCNKAMLIQLRAALREVVDRGLASRIHPGEYGGCYVPRYIARDPAKGLSFHTWGTAIDLNVPGNQRGTVGLMDRSVVQIFERWGFNWGGTWHYTDPMHFELARLVKVG